MNWTRFAFAVIAAGLVISFTDWFFFGVLFHNEYNAYPEVWRGSQKGNMPIWLALGFVTSALFIYVCAWLNLYSVSQAWKLAFLLWLALALPIIVTNALFIKMHPLVVVAHSLGWLARLTVAAACVRLMTRIGG